MRRSGVRLPKAAPPEPAGQTAVRSPLIVRSAVTGLVRQPAGSGRQTSDLTPCSTIQRPSVRLSSTTWPRAYPRCALRQPVLAWPPRCLRQLVPGDAVLGDHALAVARPCSSPTWYSASSRPTRRRQSSRSTASRSADPGRPRRPAPHRTSLAVPRDAASSTACRRLPGAGRRCASGYATRFSRAATTGVRRETKRCFRPENSLVCYRAVWMLSEPGGGGIRAGQPASGRAAAAAVGRCAGAGVGPWRDPGGRPGDWDAGADGRARST